MKNQVFGIGLGKTGTTSLNDALNILGWNSVHFPSPEVAQDILTGHSKYNAATDTPIAVNYEYLFDAYPNAKFILTLRNKKDWLKSIENHQATKGKNGANVPWIANLRQTLYGSVEFDEKLFSDAYENHFSDVLEFFNRKGAMNRLLFLDIVDEPNSLKTWTRLCDFLEVDLPVIEFPNSNKGRYNRPTEQKQQKYIPQRKQRSVKELTT